jgi:hypothetical protein
MFFKLSKDKDMLCGPACVHYILNFLKNMDVYVPNNLFWTTDIAWFLKVNTEFEIQVTCFKSNLYKDFLNDSGPKDFEGFESIRKYLYVGGEVYERQLSSTILSSILKNNIIIANVSSAVFNKDTTRKGGHFIILLKEASKNYIIANPKKASIDIEMIPKQHILNSIKDFGSWIITIKR